MKLRDKLLFVIIFSLLLQFFVSSVFTLFTFVDQSESALTDELYSSWDRVYWYMENIKHLHFTQLYSLKNLIKYYLNNSYKNEDWLSVISFFEKNLEYSQIVVTDRNYEILKNSSFQYLDTNGIRKIISNYSYNFTTNRFFINEPLAELYLITGTKVISDIDNDKQFYIFFIKKIDEKLTDIIAQELGINIAFFYDDMFVCSSIPAFYLVPENYLGNVSSLETNIGPYDFLVKVFSTDLDKKLYLTILNSPLDTEVYLSKLITSFIFAFILTLIVAVVIAIGMTSFFTSPFITLQTWLDKYMKTGKLEKLTIRTKDEIGFLAQSFYTIADKVLKEEAVIKNQLNKITFLNKYNENILSNLQAGVFVVDSDFRVEYCNNYINRLLNTKMNELLNIHIYDLLKKYFITSDNIKKLKEHNIKKYTQIPNILYEQSKSEKINFMLKIIPLWISRRKVKTLLVLEDITKTEQFWEKIVQAEKIASVGLLSAGMAHEINNPLGSILSHVQYLTAVESDPEKLDSLKWIADETRRIAELIEKLLSFAREDSALMEKTSVNPAIIEMLGFMKHDLKKRNINVVTELKPELPPALLQSNKLKQVLFNIILNSSHAINKNGTITINSDTNNSFDNSIIILISDTGKGISKSDFNRVFDPFFTTKIGERSTGLGLSICYSIITNAGGEIKVLKSSEKGTTMRIMLKTQEGKNEL